MHSTRNLKPVELLNRIQLNNNTQRLLFAFVLICFLTPTMYQAARQPNIGDVDTLRVGLLVMNRFGLEHFRGDIAMEAGTWWPYYTPAYLELLGIGYRLTGDFNTVMWLLVGAAYIMLLTGFYTLGRQVGFPFFAAVLLALLSGLYVKSASLTEWTGIRLEMANARNLYLALLPWLIRLTLHLHNRKRVRLWHWLLLGIGVGLLANLHSVTGLFVISSLIVLMLFGILLKQFRFINMVGFSLATLPGIGLIYLSTFSVMSANITAAKGAATITGSVLSANEAFHITWDTTRANLAFFRIQHWEMVIALYAILTVLCIGYFLAIRRTTNCSKLALTALATSQFLGLLVIMPQDWWVLFLTAFWIRRFWRGEIHKRDFVMLTVLTTINLLTLLAAAVAEWLVYTGIMPAFTLVARSYIRGMRMAYFPIIMFTISAIIFVYENSRYRSRLLYAGVVVGMIVLGFHETARVPVLDAMPGPILAIDGWVYGAMVLLLAWNALPNHHLRYGAAAMIIVQAITRVLGAPVSDWFTVLVGLGTLCVSATLASNASTILKRATTIGLAAVILIVALVPIGGHSIVQGVVQDFWTVTLRDWARVDTWSSEYDDFLIGEWITQQIPPDSVIVSPSTELRYYAFRPLIGGTTDASFLSGNPHKPMLQQMSADLADALQNPEKLPGFVEQYGGDYLVVPEQYDISSTSAFSPLHTEAGWTVYQYNSIQ